MILFVPRDLRMSFNENIQFNLDKVHDIQGNIVNYSIFVPPYVDILLDSGTSFIDFEKNAHKNLLKIQKKTSSK